ncbi:MAG: hypothetical protein F4Y70_05370 [Chloroflexi bacterium]|nr:hypothetical protein [Chloroflexota bacterium]MXX52362.1 hypothetical protein [Chloroflexota bacterium]MXX82887.1 hypothetical protein [Chloroflexota bacterium]MYA91795.1 hypothetical protein [Chloroflexota bacterium]MYC54276.1 hypothetical protein [Chloroflexota bacterium]
MMIIVDALQHIAPNALQLGRDYASWAWLQRRAEKNPQAPPATASLRDNLLGRVALVFGSVRVWDESAQRLPAWARYTSRDLAGTQKIARWQLDHYQRLADDNPQIRLVLSCQDLEEVLVSWQRQDDIGSRLQGIVPLLQGAVPVSEPKQIEAWLEHGARIVAPAWGSNRYVMSAGEGGDLTLLGYELLEALAGYQALLDIAGLPERAAATALERYEGAIIASHTSVRRIVDHPHCLSDPLIQQLCQRDGVLGIMLYNQYLRRDWHPSDPKRQVALSHWVDAVDYVCQLLGSAAHVGLGSAIDGGYAYSSLPAEIDTSCDLWLLRAALAERGFSDDDAAAILGGNMLRKLRESLTDG